MFKITVIVGASNIGLQRENHAFMLPGVKLAVTQTEWSKKTMEVNMGWGLAS